MVSPSGWRHLTNFYGACLLLASFAGGLVLALPPAEAQQEALLKPLTVCEALEDLKTHDGAAIAVLGRYSFRSDGRWLSENECPGGTPTAHSEHPDLIWLSYEPQSAPHLAHGYQLDGALTAEKLQLVKKHTSLKQFRFGTADYDRWAVVYGQVRAADKSSNASHHGASAELAYAGDGYVMFLRDTSR